MATTVPRLNYHTGYIITVPNEEFIGEAFGLPFLNGICDLRSLSNLVPKKEKEARMASLYECVNAGYAVRHEDGAEMEFLDDDEMTVEDPQFPREVPIEERILALLQTTNTPGGITKEDFDDAVKTAVADQFAAMKAEEADAEPAEVTA